MKHILGRQIHQNEEKIWQFEGETAKPIKNKDF